MSYSPTKKIVTVIASILVLVVLLLVFTGLVGCASTPSGMHRSAAEARATAPTSTKPQAHPHRALAIAADMIGTPYRYGGTSPRGFDCSGLVYYAYSTVGIPAPRTTTEHYRKTKRVPVSRLPPGDLVFFSGATGIEHVEMVTGNGQIIGASGGGNATFGDNPNAKVQIRSLSSDPRPHTFGSIAELLQ